MKKHTSIEKLLIFLMFLFSPYLWADGILLTSVTTEICSLLNKKSPSLNKELIEFYHNRKCLPAWSNESGVDPQAVSLLYVLNHSNEEGLNNDDPVYHRKNILTLMESISLESYKKSNPIALAQLDILLTDGYMTLGKHLYYGVLPREAFIKEWSIPKKKPINIGDHLHDALENKNIQTSLEELSPSSHGYQTLKKLLLEYLKIPNKSGSNETNLSLNSDIEEKITIIRLNMERWRWVPDVHERSYILVNIPDFSLSVIKEEKTALKIKAIVGKKKRETPIFNATLKYIVVNPYWNVPITILREDIFPKVRKNISYLKKEKIRLFKQGNDKKEINPYTINWKDADANSFPYRLRQDTGAKNVLGRLKFVFPNSRDIYIHDTPSKYLFDKDVRTFSSGCVRIKEPIKFANYLLKNDNNGWGDKNISTLINKGSHKSIFLATPIKVQIQYWTVWVDDEGVANFRDDVYGYDKNLAKLLGW